VTGITNEVQRGIGLLQSTKKQIALNNVGANALFGFPIFCYPWGKNHVLRPSVL